MKILRFTISGKQAFFKDPQVNSYFYFTYGQIHKVALLGIFGAIMGYSGYGQIDKKNDIFPMFYSKLKELKISIIPYGECGYFSKKMISFNNSVGYASGETGGNLIVKEQWLENPKWDIYVMLDNEESLRLSDMLINRKCVYVPYLGKNDHFADIEDVEIINGDSSNDVEHIDSLFMKENALIDMQDYDTENPFKYEESLPIGIDENLNLYDMNKFVYTNISLTDIKGDVYKVDKGRNIMFY